MIGRQFGHYTITAELGRGGMGEVYRALDSRLGREVALKLLRPDLANDDALRRRLEQEARSVAALRHPHIVTLYSVEEDAGRLFLTMELVQGASLAELLERGALDGARAIELATAIADAIAVAHRNGVVHRDLKPGNIMLDDEAGVKVLDFGLAQHGGLPGALEDSAATQALTREGSFSGTVAYMSPEQAQGQRVDARSDVFSLGILLYEMATGQRPFTGDNPIALLSATMKDDPAPHPAIPPQLAPIIRRCLQKAPGDRYANAGELHEDLVALGATNKPAGPPRPRWAVAAGLSSLLVVALLGWFLFGPGGSTAPGEGDAGAVPNVVVVFPFENLGSADHAYFADGMTDEIVSRLSSVAGLGVISRVTALRYDREGKPLAQIAAELGVNFVLEGTIRWDRRAGGSRVRVTPQLVRVSDGTSAWSESFDRELDDVFVIQSEIARQVATNIDASLVTDGDGSARRTDDLDAYDDYLRAKELAEWGLGPSPERLEQASALLERALELDDQFALAHAELSLVHSARWFRYIDRSDARARLAGEAAARAIELEPNLARAHLARAMFHYRTQQEYELALEELATARRLAPGDGEMLSWTGSVLKRQGRFASALEYLERAIQLDPFNPTPIAEAMIVSMITRDFDNSRRFISRLTALDPSFQNRSELARMDLREHGDLTKLRLLFESTEGLGGSHWASLLTLERKFPEALAALDATIEDPPALLPHPGEYVLRTRSAGDDWILRALIHYWLGDREKMLQATAAAMPLIPQDKGPGALMELGVVLALEGRGDEALAALERIRPEFESWSDATTAAKFLHYEAIVRTILGDDATAIRLVDELLRVDAGLYLGVLEAEPIWDSLRDHPDYVEVVGRYR